MIPNPRFGSDQPKRRDRIPDQIPVEEFQELLMQGKIVDGRCGGMLLGKNPTEGPTRIVFKLGSSYVLHGSATGGCFIINGVAAARNMSRIKAIHAMLTMRETVTPEDAGAECGQLIVTTAYPHDRLLWLDYMSAVIAPEPTQKHMGELQRMNFDPNPYLRCDHYEILGCDFGGSTDGIV